MLPFPAQFLRRSLQAIAGSLLPIAAFSLPAWSADRLYLSYGAIERSIPLSALETYAQTGQLNSDLYVYSRSVDPTLLPRFRAALLTRADLSPVAISQFLHSPQGEILLRRLGQVVQPESRDNGFYAIRAALVLAASDPAGLTPLNVFRQFPTRGVRIDLQRTLETVDALGKAVNQTTQISTKIAKLANLEDQETSPNLPLDLSQRGLYSWETQTLTLFDRRRQSIPSQPAERIFPADLYFPRQRNPRSSPRTAPLVIISHGLGSDRTTFRYLAEHLASHGFAVAVPEHPGSNAKQLQALMSGTANEVADPSEFIARPLDIKYLLDTLTEKAKTEPRYSHLNLKQVGLIGQSFGGYTALTLAGATIDFSLLRKTCRSDVLNRTLNISLFLQCRAMALPPLDYPLADPRIKAIMAINPIVSAVLGETGIRQVQIPTLLVSSNGDTVAPALSEQLQPFTWLPKRSKSDRYLALIDKGTHFSTLQQTKDQGVPVPPDLIGPTPAIARDYMMVLSLAFLQTYIAQQSQYRPYLSSGYVKTLVPKPIPQSRSLDLSVVKSLPIKIMN